MTPKPLAAFSTLTTQKSMACSWRSRARCLATAARPGSPKTSPTMRMFIASASFLEGSSLLRYLDGARLADHDHLDVPGVLHLGLDALGDVLGQLVGVEVAHDLGLGDHPQLAPGLDRVAHLHALVAERDLLQLGQALDVRLEHVTPGAGPRRRDAVGGLHQHRL